MCAFHLLLLQKPFYLLLAAAKHLVFFLRILPVHLRIIPHYVRVISDAFAASGVSMTMLDLFTGGALSNFSVFSLGIMPYIHGIHHHAADAGRYSAVGRWAKREKPVAAKITQVTRF